MEDLLSPAPPVPRTEKTISGTQTNLAGTQWAGVDWADLPDEALVARAQELEHLSRTLDGAKTRAAGELHARYRQGRFEETGAANPVMLIRDITRISPQEAARRLAVAAATEPVTDPFSLIVSPPRCPALAAALTRGDASLETATVIARHVEHVNRLETSHQTPAGATTDLDATLTGYAHDYSPDLLNRIAQRVVDHLDPDGDQPTDSELIAKEGITFHQPRRGLVGFHGHLTTPDYEELLTAIGTATNPRTTNTNQPDHTSEPDDTSGTSEGRAAGCGPAWAGSPTAAAPWQARPVQAGPVPDELARNFATTTTSPEAPPPKLDQRTRAQKLLHRLVDCARRATTTSLFPANGGLRPQLIITMNLTDLQKGIGTAHLPFTGPVPVSTIRHTACDAHLIPMILGADNHILNVGRNQRIIPDTLRKALTARDQGCTFPGCDRPAPWTEAHHIIPWANGGETSLDNSCLLCSYHHHLIHRTNWTIQLHDGRAYFTPPATLDHHQKPRRNHYHHPPTHTLKQQKPDQNHPTNTNHKQTETSPSTNP